MSRRAKPAPSVEPAAAAPPADTFPAPRAETDAALNAAQALARRAIALGGWLDQTGVSLPWPLALQLVALVADAGEVAGALARFRERMGDVPHG